MSAVVGTVARGRARGAAPWRSARGTASGGSDRATASPSSGPGTASRGSGPGTVSGGSAVGTASCIYEGTIRHHRRDPRRSFDHRIALFYLDLAELPRLLGGRLVARRPGTLRFRRRDYLGPEWLPLDVSVRDKVHEATGGRPAGPIRLLTQLRSFGHCFNPVSFYYCFDRADDRVEALVAEVTNTPWGQRHAYVLGAMDDQGRPALSRDAVTDSAPPSGPGLGRDAVTGPASPSGPGRGLTGEFAKALHVSPFMAMDHRYAVRAAVPGERLAVHIESRRLGAPAFEAALVLRRTELTRPAAARLTCRYPVAGARVLGLIYGHALALKLAGATVYPHPGSGPRPHQLTGGQAP